LANVGGALFAADQYAVLVHKLYDEDYLTMHTNALFLGHAAFGFNDGLFTGFDEDKLKYDTET
jgi:formate dehydrogenase major subunit